VKTGLTRRHVLRGAGVALALPWLESLAPRHARGQSTPRPVRFVPIYFPLGADYPNGPDYWTPSNAGSGDAWQLSPLLEPFAPVKSRVSVLGHVDQSAFGAPATNPGNGPLTAAYLTCVKCQVAIGNSAPTAGTSIDQRIAQALDVKSLQVGLSTMDSYCEGPCEFARSISWSNPTTPLYKLVNPQDVFDQIVAGTPAGNLRARGRQSVLDFVLANATDTQKRLGRSDRARMDQFLTSVRDLEMRVASTPACSVGPRPTLSASVGNVPPDYNRDDHANVMIDLIVMALACDAARVVSFMLDDARSYFIYDFLPMRHFTTTGSVPATGTVNASPIGIANAGDGNDLWSTLTWWYASKASLLCQKLAAVPDGPNGQTLLDNSIVWFGSGQQGENVALNLPLLYAGSGGGALRTNQAFRFAPSQRVSNVYLTFLQKVFAVNDATFGDSTGIIPELLV
jgi:hypothetical protein